MLDKAGYCFYGPQLVAKTMGRVATVLMGQGIHREVLSHPLSVLNTWHLASLQRWVGA